MKEFRIGQRVRALRSLYHPEIVGRVGTITSALRRDGGYGSAMVQSVEFDDDPTPGQPWCGPPNAFEPIDDNTGDWRVIEHVTKWNPYKEKMPS